MRMRKVAFYDSRLSYLRATGTLRRQHECNLSDHVTNRRSEGKDPLSAISCLFHREETGEGGPKCAPGEINAVILPAWFAFWCNGFLTCSFVPRAL